MASKTDGIVDYVIKNLALFGVLAVIAFIATYFGGLAKFGIDSYNGLSPQQIKRVYAEFLKRYPALSRVGGNNFMGYFERGVAGNGGVLYYFHYNDDGKGAVSFSIYPEVFESWTTDPGFFGIGNYLTGVMK